MASRGAPIGNQNAKKGKLIEDLLRKVCVQEDNKRISAALSAILDKAAEGDLRCLEFVRDTFDGKPAQSVDLSGGLSIEKRAQDLSDDELAAIVATNSRK